MPFNLHSKTRMKKLPDLPFYVDHEIYMNPDTVRRSASQERSVGLFFPADQFGDLPQSFSAATFSPVVSDSLSFTMGSSSFTEYVIPSFAEARGRGTGTELGDKGRVESPQVALFWERYREYPTFLKLVKKRQRRRNRRTRDKEKAKKLREDGGAQQGGGSAED